MEPAIEVLRQADLFVIIGTSLAVYPAASLLHYAPEGIPVFVIDPCIPAEARRRGFYLIEKEDLRRCKRIAKNIIGKVLNLKE